MSVLTIGFLLLLLGIAFMGMPDLNRTLKQHDREQWNTLLGYQGAFMAPFDRLTLFSWTLSRRFEGSDNIDIQYAGYQAFKQATRVKYTLLVGISLIIIGSITSLLGY
ncbi:hypothetical protein L2755_03235 [Shewanella abyssi]|uniref:hypothetical protein n=1 Tax=Shewanella abyssi TaxID=311789 RepID=UPI00200ED6D7|nr:hypothetical protein [Shewanella abyssi]MCL1048649.1 hypothetical protein [Shewanella abyssi]